MKPLHPITLGLCLGLLPELALGLGAAPTSAQQQQAGQAAYNQSLSACLASHRHPTQ